MSIEAHPSIPTPQNGASQTVERIREIIIGRQLNRLEQRINQLETPPPAEKSNGRVAADIDTEWMERLLHHEAKLEALQDQMTRLTGATREMTESRLAQFREETQRLASHIHQKAAYSAQNATPAVQVLETKIGSWLGDWQHSFYNHLQERDRQLNDHLHQETTTLRETVEAQMTRLESCLMNQKEIEERFQRIARAAKALAECAASPTPFPSAS